MRGKANLIKKVALLSMAAIFAGAIPAFAQVSQEVINDPEVQVTDSTQNQYRHQYKKSIGDSLMDQNRHNHRYHHQEHMADSLGVRKQYRRSKNNGMPQDSGVMKRERKRIRDENCDGVPDSAQVRTRKRSHMGTSERKSIRKRMGGENPSGTSHTGSESGTGSKKRQRSHGGHN